MLALISTMYFALPMHSVLFPTGICSSFSDQNPGNSQQGMLTVIKWPYLLFLAQLKKVVNFFLFWALVDPSILK